MNTRIYLSYILLVQWPSPSLPRSRTVPDRTIPPYTALCIVL